MNANPTRSELEQLSEASPLGLKVVRFISRLQRKFHTLQLRFNALEKDVEALRLKGERRDPSQVSRERLREAVNTVDEQVTVKTDDILDLLYRTSMLEARQRDMARVIGLPEKVLNEVLHVVAARKPSFTLGHFGFDLSSNQAPDLVPHNDNAR